MSKTLDQRYIKVAQACLKILNNLVPGADRSKQIQELHSAIENAVNDLYKQQELELGRVYATLRAIEALPDDPKSLEQAKALARQATPTAH